MTLTKLFASVGIVIGLLWALSRMTDDRQDRMAETIQIYPWSHAQRVVCASSYWSKNLRRRNPARAAGETK